MHKNSPKKVQIATRGSQTGQLPPARFQNSPAASKRASREEAFGEPGSGPRLNCPNGHPTGSRRASTEGEMSANQSEYQDSRYILAKISEFPPWKIPTSCVILIKNVYTTQKKRNMEVIQHL